MTDHVNQSTAHVFSRFLAVAAVLMLVGVVFLSLRASRSSELAASQKDEAAAMLLAASQIAGQPSTEVASREIQLAMLDELDPATAGLMTVLAQPEPNAGTGSSLNPAIKPAADHHAESHHAAGVVGFDPIAQCEECLANRPFRFMPQRWTPDLIDQCLEVAAAIDPDLGIQLAAKRGKTDADEAKFLKELQQSAVGSRLLAMTQLKNRDPELYKTKISELSSAMQVRRQAAQLREAMQSGSEGQVESLREQLRGQLRVQLALSIKARGDYICKLDERIHAARQQLERDVKHFDETVERELQALTQTPVAAQPGVSTSADR